MSHSPKQSSELEHRRLLKLAREYRSQGYDVTLHPTPDELPTPLADCSVDLVASSEEKTIAAEVRTKENLKLNGTEDIRRIAESVQQVPGWEFELVITNSRKKAG
ncbi:MAG: hypothetical protein IGS50_10950 [Synechococcales cyanobacterium C42_A2020_086]|jgi:hypothetical protein|nr:hypothetical protein [Synechococcales cyanobacterium C42_A2020_086]